MSVIIIGTGGHKAIQLLRDTYPKMTDEQKVRAHALEDSFLDDAQALADEVNEAQG